MIIKTFSALLLLSFYLFSSKAMSAGWEIDCGNYCYFNDLPQNCHGVRWVEPNGDKIYSEWSDQYSGCLQGSIQQLIQPHLILPSQFNCHCPAAKVPPPRTAPLTTATREQLKLIREQIRSWIHCAPDPATTTSANPAIPFSFSSVKSCKEFQNANSWAVSLNIFEGETGLYWWPKPVDYNADSIEQQAPGCMMGELNYCENIRRSQDPITGAWYRNEYRRRNPASQGGIPHFSRDHGTGVMGYLTATKNKVAAKKWLTFIKNNPKRPPLNFYNLCPPRPNIPRPSWLNQSEWDDLLPDDRCNIVPDFWALAYRTFLYIGITDNEIKAISPDIWGQMVAGRAIDSSILTSAKTAPAVGGSGFQLALTSFTTHIRLRTGDNSSTLREAISIVNKRTSYSHPIHEWLDQNRVATEYQAYLIKKYCSGPKPLLGLWATSGNQAASTNPTSHYWAADNINQTSYQNYGGTGQYDSTYRVAGGHECLMWLSLILNDNRKYNMVCEDGEQLLNGACQTVAFTKPLMPAVPGLGWSVNVGAGKLNYAYVNGNKCPFGGTYIRVTNDPNLVWQNHCEVSVPGLNNLNPNVNYWADPDPRYPGIYYAQVNNQCPYGGSFSGPNCQLKSFPLPSPYLWSGVSYSVSSDPQNPGVFYNASSQGTCNYGGTRVGGKCQIYTDPNGKLNPDTVYFVRSNLLYPGIFHYPRLVAPGMEPNYKNESYFNGQ